MHLNTNYCSKPEKWRKKTAKLVDTYVSLYNLLSICSQVKAKVDKAEGYVKWSQDSENITYWKLLREDYLFFLLRKGRKTNVDMRNCCFLVDDHLGKRWGREGINSWSEDNAWSSSITYISPLILDLMFVFVFICNDVHITLVSSILCLLWYIVVSN